MSPCFAFVVLLHFLVGRSLVTATVHAIPAEKAPQESRTFREVFRNCSGVDKKVGCILLKEDGNEGCKTNGQCSTAAMTEFVPDRRPEGTNTRYQFTIAFEIHPEPSNWKTYAALGVGNNDFVQMVDVFILHCGYFTNTSGTFLTSATRWAYENKYPQATKSMRDIRGREMTVIANKTFFDNGKYVKCVFDLPRHMTVEYWLSERKKSARHVFNFDRETYFLMFTSNNKINCTFMKDNKELPTDLCYHGPYPYYTERKVNLTQPVFRRGHVKAQWLVAVHGMFMVISYMGLIPIATIIARFFRETWSEKHVLKKRVWYSIHVGLLCIAFALITFATFSIMIRNFEVWPDPRGSQYHAIIGIISYLIVLSQVTLHFIIRHDCPTAKKIYSRVHAVLGMVAYILGQINLLMAPLFLPTFVDCDLILVTTSWIPTHFTVWVCLATWMIITDHKLMGNQNRFRAIKSFPMRIKTLEDAPGSVVRVIFLCILIASSITCVSYGSFVVFYYKNCNHYLSRTNRPW